MELNSAVFSFFIFAIAKGTQAHPFTPEYADCSWRTESRCVCVYDDGRALILLNYIAARPVHGGEWFRDKNQFRAERKALS